jgi:transcriptional regulator with XRE-family HTH domain
VSKAKVPRVRARTPFNEKRRRLLAQLKLGELLRARREDAGLNQSDVARAVGWSQGYYAELEGGIKSSPDMARWLKVADVLQLGRTRILELIGQIRGEVSLLLPPIGDGRRDAMLALAAKQFGGGEPLP